MSRSAVELLRSQYREAGDWFMNTLTGVDDEVAAYAPPGGLVSPIAGQIGHILVGLDLFVLNTIGERPPLLFSDFAERRVFSEPPPESGEFLEWGQRITVDYANMRAYTSAIFQTIDEMLAGMSDADLDGEADFGPMGKQKVSWALNIMLLNTHIHTGEISALKGLQGLKGYPM